MPKDWLRTEQLARITQNQIFCDGILRFEAALELDHAEIAVVIRDLHWSTYYLRYGMWVERELETAESRARLKHNSGSVTSPPASNLLPATPSGVFRGDITIPLTPEPEAGIDARLQSLVRTIKASSQYLPSMGAELDILAPPASALNSVTTQPKLRVEALIGGAIQLTVRPMRFSSVSFQCRVAGAASFLTIAKAALAG